MWIQTGLNEYFLTPGLNQVLADSQDEQFAPNLRKTLDELLKEGSRAS